MNAGEKEERRKRVPAIVYYTLAHIFEYQQSQTLVNLVENDLTDESDQSDDDYESDAEVENNDEYYVGVGDYFVDDFNDSLNADDNISETLINFVGSVLKPFGFDLNTLGKGSMTNLNHRMRYFSMIPAFFRLQQYIEEENQIHGANLRNFVLIPVYNYQRKHIAIDRSGLHSLCSSARIYRNPRTENLLTYAEFVGDKNLYNVPNKWYELFELADLDKKSNNGFNFDSRITTDAITVSILFKKEK